jgi:hypothetical protein
MTAVFTDHEFAVWQSAQSMENPFPCGDCAKIQIGINKIRIICDNRCISISLVYKFDIVPAGNHFLYDKRYMLPADVSRLMGSLFCYDQMPTETNYYMSGRSGMQFSRFRQIVPCAHRHDMLYILHEGIQKYVSVYLTLNLENGMPCTGVLHAFHSGKTRFVDDRM